MLLNFVFFGVFEHVFEINNLIENDAISTLLRDFSEI